MDSSAPDKAVFATSSRKALQVELEQIFRDAKVYYQPPESIKLEYPCLVYKREAEDVRYADNVKYNLTRRYTLTLIDKVPDSKYIEPLMALPYCTHDRHYVTDHLHHDIFTLHW